MIRVAQINSVCGIRSTGRIASDLADALDATGGQSLLIYGREYVPEAYQSRAYRMETELGVRLHGIRARLFDEAGFGSAAATKRLLKKLDAFAPDILHLHNLHGYYIHLPILFQYIKEKEIPVVMTLHDCWTFTGHCSHFEFVNCEKWKTGCFACPQKKEYPASLWLDRSSQNYLRKKASLLGVKNLTIVTPSRWLADTCRNSFLGEYPIQTIPNGIDLHTFTPTQSDLRAKYGLENKKILLAVSTAWGDGRKGLGDIVELADLLPEDCQIVIIGVTEKEEAVLPPSVLSIRRTDDVRQLAQWYTAADVFINPTYEDTYPTTNLEAIACGTPVVTYPSGGSPEAVIPGVTGLVTKNKDVGELLEQSLQAMGLKESAIHTHAKQFGKDVFAQRYLEVYQQLCLQKG